MSYEYQFPEKLPFRAKEVTEPEFYIQSRKDWFDALWVDFSSVRSSDQFDRMKFDLGMEDNKLVNIPNEYVKIIFSGHRGCGKSIELRRFADSIDYSDGLFVVFIDLEKEANIEQLSSEDLFVVMISLLVRTLENRGVSFNNDDFSALAKEWMTEEELERVINTEYGGEVGVSISAGWSFWKFLSTEGNLKGSFSRNTNTTNTIRQKIKTNPKPLLTKLNAALVALRTEIKKAGAGQDIIFIIDGLEKANHEVYESLFIKDVQLVTGIKAHMISTVPISTFYEILHLPSHDYFKDFYLPMIRVNPESTALLKNMIERRVDKDLFDDNVLDMFVEKSGGCPRILLKLVNRAILDGLGKRVTTELAKKAIVKEGNERWRALTEKHREILQSRKWESADKEVLELLHSLNILEYNGMNIERQINPLIAQFIVNHGE